MGQQTPLQRGAHNRDDFWHYGPARLSPGPACPATRRPAVPAASIGSPQPLSRVSPGAPGAGLAGCAILAGLRRAVSGEACARKPRPRPRPPCGTGSVLSFASKKGILVFTRNGLGVQRLSPDTQPPLQDAARESEDPEKKEMARSKRIKQGVG